MAQHRFATRRYDEYQGKYKENAESLLRSLPSSSEPRLAKLDTEFRKKIEDKNKDFRAYMKKHGALVEEEESSRVVSFTQMIGVLCGSIVLVIVIMRTWAWKKEKKKVSGSEASDSEASELSDVESEKKIPLTHKTT